MDAGPLSPTFPAPTWRWGPSSHGCSLACAPVNNSTNGLVTKSTSESQFLVCIEKQHHGGNRSYCQRWYFLFLPRLSMTTQSCLHVSWSSKLPMTRSATRSSRIRKPSESGHEATLPPTLTQRRPAQHAVLRPREMTPRRCRLA